MPNPTVSAGYTRALLEFAVDRGVARDALVRRSGIRLADLTEPEARVSVTSYLALMQAAVALSGEPALALRFGESVRTEGTSIAWLIAASAETVEAGHRQLNRYARLVLDEDDDRSTELLSLVRRGRETRLEFRPALAPAARYLVEAGFARCVCGTRAALKSQLGARPFPRAIHFRHAEPSYRAEYELIFGVPLTFGSDRNALVVDEQFLSIRLPTANRYLFGILCAHGDRLLKSLESARSTRGRVECHLLPALHTGKASMTLIAREMGVSRQTLFRRLKAEHVTFEQVLDDLRHRMAVDYLTGGKTSITETAYLLGFSEPAAFSRAFKRWTGVSPRNLRREA